MNKKYNRKSFYGGVFCAQGEIRLIKAIICQALKDSESESKTIKKEAKKFLNSEDFKYYCRLLDSAYIVE